MKLKYLLPLIFALPAFGQTTNSDILPASTGLNLGRTTQRWNGYFQNININGTCTFNGVTCTFGGGGGGGSTVNGTSNQITASVSNPQILSFPNTVVMPGTLTVNSSGFSLSGASQGRPLLATSSGLVVQTAATYYVTPFTTGVDPCDKIATGHAQLSSAGNGVVDSRGLGTGNLTPACSAATAHAMFASSTSGWDIFGNYTIWVPLKESAAGTLGTTNFPPQGVIVLPNKFVGITGAGRGDASTGLGTTIAVCKGTNNPITGCVAPDQTRINTVTSTDITYAAGRTYLGINMSGSDIVAGEPFRLQGSSKTVNDGPWRACNLSVSNSTRTDANCPANPTSSKIYAPVPSGIVSVTIGGTNTGYTTPVTVNVTGNSCVIAPVLTATQSGGVVNSVVVQSPGDGCQSGSAPTATLTSGGSSNATLTLNIESACASNCGSAIGEIPVVDLPLLTTSSGNQFAQQLRYLSIDCEGILTCAGYRSMSGNEQSGLDHVKIAGSPERDIDVHGFIAQNADTFKALELYGGTTLGTNCDPTTSAAFFGENGPHGLTDTTVNFGNCAHTVIAGVIIDTNTYPFLMDKSHCENTEYCWLAGQDSAAQYFHLADDAGGPISQCGDVVNGNCVPLDGAYQNGVSSVIAISRNFTGSGSPATKDFTIQTITRNTGATNILADWRNTTTGTTDHISSQNSLELYAFDNSPTGCNALNTTDSGIVALFCFLSSINIVTAPGFTSTGSAGIVSGATIVQSSTASNTDFTGELTLSGGTITRSWTGTYTSHPECTATDQSGANAVRVQYTGVTSVTFTGTGTDVLSYICAGRN